MYCSPGSRRKELQTKGFELSTGELLSLSVPRNKLWLGQLIGLDKQNF